MSEQLTPPELDRFLAPFTPVAAELAIQTRRAILDVFPDAIETAEGRELGYGFDRGYKGLVFSISMKKTGVNLGIAFGAAMPDPDGLMKGAGKVHRHVEILSADRAAGPELHALLTRALSARRKQVKSATL